MDTRYALRLMLTRPSLTIIAVVSLAVGIGANTAIFSMLDVVFWRALPAREPHDLVKVGVFSRSEGRVRGLPGDTIIDFLDVTRNRAFSGLLTYSTDGISLDANGRAERVQGQAVSSNYFSVLGVGAFVGRTFEDGVWAPEAVLSYDFWLRRFGGNVGVVGKTIRLNGYPFTVVGVSARGFFGFEVGESPEVRIRWLATGKQIMPALPLITGNGAIVGRLRSGLGQHQARSISDAYFQHLLEGRPQTSVASRYRSSHIILEPGDKGTSGLRKALETPLTVLMVVVALVLLTACANVANLLLARAEGRRGEIAVRLALGASSGRLARQLLTESTLLALIGGILGITGAYWGADLLFAFLPQNYTPTVIDIHPDLRALAFTVLISIATGVLFGMAPAIQAARTDLAPTLKNAGSVMGLIGVRFPFRRILVVTQVAVSVILLLGAGLFMHSLRNLERVDAGMRYDDTLLFTMKHVQERYSLDQIRDFCVTIVQQVKALAGVRSASLSEGPPFSARVGSTSVAAVGQPLRSHGLLEAIDDRVMPGFFGTLNIPFLAGRDFELSDRGESRKVAIINDALQHALFANRNPLGQRIVLGSSKDEFEIIGVVRGAKYENLRELPQPAVYMSILQGGSPGMPTLLVHATGGSSYLVSAVRHEFDVLDKELPVFNVKTMRRAIDESLAEERLVAALSGIFGVTALLLASLGLYGVVAYTVARRTREIGLRMALGADRKAVQSMVMRNTIGMVMPGCVIGLIAALAAGRILAHQLFGIKPGDVPNAAAAVAIVIAISAIAGYVPARRAARLDPMAILRQE